MKEEVREVVVEEKVEETGAEVAARTMLDGEATVVVVEIDCAQFHQMLEELLRPYERFLVP